MSERTGMLPCLKWYCIFWNAVTGTCSEMLWSRLQMLLPRLYCCCHVWSAVVPLWWVAPPGYGRQRWRVRPPVAASSAGAPAVHPHYSTHTQSLIRGPLLGRTYTNITIIYQGSGSGSSMVHIIWAPDPGSDLVLNKKSEKKRKKLSCKNSLGTRIQ